MSARNPAPGTSSFRRASATWLSVRKLLDNGWNGDIHRKQSISPAP